MESLYRERTRRADLPSDVNAVLFRRQDGWTPSGARRWLGPDWQGEQFTDVQSDGGDVLDPGDYIRFKIAPESKSKKFTSFGYMSVSDKYPGVFFQIGGFREGRRRNGGGNSIESHERGVPRVVSVDTMDAHVLDCKMMKDIVESMPHGWRDEPAIITYSDGEAIIDDLGVAVDLLCESRRASDHLGPEGRYFVDYIIGKDVRTSPGFVTDDEALKFANKLDVFDIPVVGIFEQDPTGETVNVFVAEGW